MPQDKTKIHLDIKKFQQVLRDLKRITAATYEDVIASQTRIILEKAAKATKQVKVKNIIGQHMPIGKRIKGFSGKGNVPFKQYNGKTYYLFNRLPDEVWFPILERSKAKTISKIERRGISKGQFSAWATSMNLRINNTKEAKRMIPFLLRKGLTKASRMGKAEDVIFEMVSFVKLGNVSNAHFAMASAIQRRINHFKNALRHDVFKDVKQIKKQFGITSR